ncbi:hypothetical protein FIBSPDRAFT_861381 [Athelia psychrophila]|uniref:Uncharacterized protein n=1 Tax=Athelia psychrophila TaxID=1759441 RepID=A0A166J9L1_9AGAM|nr:hypothetical protein FIBSPDRAFT_861381 [Fibularhizoctonia sp. CBS 109695]
MNLMLELSFSLPSTCCVIMPCRTGIGLSGFQHEPNAHGYSAIVLLGIVSERDATHDGFIAMEDSRPSLILKSA